MKPLILTDAQWHVILSELKKEYPRTVFILRNRMKQVLGFTVREHKQWVPNSSYDREYKRYLYNKDTSIFIDSAEPYKGHTEHQIHLDFYSERKRDFFLLKYSELLRDSYGTSTSRVI